MLKTAELGDNSSLHRREQNEFWDPLLSKQYQLFRPLHQNSDAWLLGAPEEPYHYGQRVAVMKAPRVTRMETIHTPCSLEGCHALGRHKKSQTSQFDTSLH